MKQYFALGLVLALLTGFAGCGFTKEPGLPPPQDTAGLVHGDAVPVLTLDSPAAKRVNDEIAWVMQEYEVERSAYFTSMRGDVLSLILCLAEETGDTFYVWHINTKTGETVTNEELLRLAGWGRLALLENLQRKMDHFYGGPQERDRIYRKMTSELQDIERLRLYLGEDGRLFWVCQFVFPGDEKYKEVLLDPDLEDTMYTVDMETGWGMLG